MLEIISETKAFHFCNEIIEKIKTYILFPSLHFTCRLYNNKWFDRLDIELYDFNNKGLLENKGKGKFMSG